VQNPIPRDSAAIPRDYGDCQALRECERGSKLGVATPHPMYLTGDGAGFYRFPV
jgi:hypothetical protein